MTTTEYDSQQFHLGDILSITTGFLVSPDRMGGVYRILEVQRFGEHREVRPLAAEDHTSIDPIAEMRMLKPDAQILVIEAGA